MSLATVHAVQSFISDEVQHCCKVRSFDVFSGVQVVDLLVSQGADVTTVNHEGQTAVELATTSIIRQQLLAAVDKGGPHHNLCQAAWQGNANVLHKILVCTAFM